VSAQLQSSSQPVTRVRISHGLMVLTSEVREQKTYTIRNEDTHARTVVIEHPHRPEYKLDAGLEPAETTATMYRFRVHVEPKKTETFTVNEAKSLFTQYVINNLTDDQVTLFVRQKTINPEIEAALRKILAQKAVIAGLDRELQSHRDETKRIFDDQQRLRENMKALKGSAEEKALLQRYTKELDDQENRLDAIRKETSDLEARRAQAQAELNRMIEELQFDATL
jgi:DNA repair exonuclease SbcCD ATPase subunit